MRLAARGSALPRRLVPEVDAALKTAPDIDLNTTAMHSATAREDARKRNLGSIRATTETKNC